MKLMKVTMTLHRWVSLIVGIQLLIWLSTGLYFNLMDTDKVSGRGNQTNVAHAGNLSAFRLISPASIDSAPVQAVKLIWINQHPYYHFIYSQGEHTYQKRQSSLFDAVSGSPFTLSAKMAYDIAKASYSGNGKLEDAVKVTPPIADDVKQQNPVWMVRVDDELDTAIYIDEVSGRVIRHVNDHARLKDLMLKLHFMDYGDSGGFNHVLIVIAALLALGLSVTGSIWLYKLYRTGQLRIISRRRIRG